MIAKFLAVIIVSLAFALVNMISIIVRQAEV